MEHVTEGLYLAASAGMFVLAVSLMLLAGRLVDGLFDGVQNVQTAGNVIREATQYE